MSNKNIRRKNLQGLKLKSEDIRGSDMKILLYDIYFLFISFRSDSCMYHLHIFLLN